MKTKKIISAFLTLAMVLSMPFYAYADITQTVSAGFGEGMEQHVTVNGDVSVVNETNAVFVEAHAPEDYEDKNASAIVNGNVTAKSDAAFSAVYVEGRNGDAYAEITGSLVATVESYANVNGVELWGRSYNGTGWAYAKAGSISVTTNGSATGINNDCGDASVTNDVTVSGADAKGVESYSEGNVYIGGNLKATGSGDVCGIDLYTQDEKQQNITVGKDVAATYTSDSIYSTTDAVRLFAGYDAKTYAEIKGNVIASNTAGTATGLQFYSGGSGISSLTSAYYSVKVGNSIISDGYGIGKYNDTGTADVLVENEINAKKVAVLLVDNAYLYEGVSDGSAYSANQLNLTAWKLNVNEKGNVAELYVQNAENVENMPQNPATAKDFEKKINYIIKAQQPKEYGTVSFVDASGNALKKSYDYDVANEGEKVVLKPNLKTGYRIKAAYNETDTKVPLSKDANGNFYIIVPKGGGINISVEVEKAPEPVPTVKAKKANPLKIKGKKVTLKATKVAEKTQRVSVKSAIKFVKKGKGTISYKKLKGNKKITVNKKTGKFTVKKGLAKGTYKVKVKVTAKGNKSYKKGAKTTTVKIVIN